MLSEQRQCPYCGTYYIPRVKKQATCGEYKCMKDHTKVMKANAKPKPKKKKRKSLLTELNNEARDKGMTYGQLMAKETVELFGRVEI